jgi:glucose/arabinose dehydrogenase
MTAPLSVKAFHARVLLVAGVALLASGLAAGAGPTQAQPTTAATCDGYPRAPIGMAPGFCAGLVVAPPSASFASRTLRLPRSLLQLPKGDWIVSDLGGWGTTRGAIWRLRASPGRPAELTPLLRGLNLPHALALGPDGLVYVGEMSRIFRFDPAAADPAASVATVIEGLPDNRLHDNRHPLSKFVFTPAGDLLVNVGARSDQCLDAGGKAPGPTCPEVDGPEASGVLRLYRSTGPGQWSRDWTILASGLRNSVALAVHPSGTILQGENSYDLPGRFTPFDEINQIVPGATYGWPYCADVAAPTPGWPAVKGCGSEAYRPPALLLPPHAAPLDLAWYQGAMFPQLNGRLLVTWHGYRATAGRLAAYETDALGLPIKGAKARYPVYGEASRRYMTGPSANALILTPGWGKAAGRRQGSPVGLAVAADGAIWVTDDRAGQVIRIAVDRP